MAHGSSYPQKHLVRFLMIKTKGRLSHRWALEWKKGERKMNDPLHVFQRLRSCFVRTMTLIVLSYDHLWNSLPLLVNKKKATWSSCLQAFWEKGQHRRGCLSVYPHPWKSPVPPLSLRISILGAPPPIISTWSRKIWRFPGWSHLFPPSVPSPLLRGGCRDSVFNFWDSGCLLK